jgi:hypothetical protein
MQPTRQPSSQPSRQPTSKPTTPSGIHYDDDDVYLEYFSGKGFHMNYSVCMSYVKHINSSNKA